MQAALQTIDAELPRVWRRATRHITVDFVDVIRRAATNQPSPLRIAVATCGGHDPTPFDDLGVADDPEERVMMRVAVAAASVTLRVHNGTAEALTVCTTTTDAAGAYECRGLTIAGTGVLTAMGGTMTQATGGTIVLPPSATMHLPVMEIITGERRDAVNVTPLPELVWSLGQARWASGENPDYVSAMTAARMHVKSHFGFDVLTTDVASVTAPTMTEAAQVTTPRVHRHCS